MKMLNTRVEKKNNLRCSRIYGQNGSEINNEKKNLWTVVPVFEYKQVMFCGILENYSSFCTRKRVVIQLFKL